MEHAPPTSCSTVFALRAAEAFAADQERRRRLLLAAAPAVKTGMGAQLVLAADQFLIRPASRVEDAGVYLSGKLLRRAPGADRTASFAAAPCWRC